MLNSTFICAMCLKEWPIAYVAHTGSQLWCDADSKSYGTLTTRWKTLPKLKTWWNSLKASYFCNSFVYSFNQCST